MSISFSRSMRSLNADSFRPSLIGLVLAITLLTAWMAWFFLARVGLYEVSQNTQITQDGVIMAQFPLETQSRIFPGQPAYLRLSGSTGQERGVIPAMVVNTSHQRNTQHLQVELVALADPTSSAPLEDGLTGQVEIEVERISPASLVFQTTGQLLDSPQSAFSR